MIFSSVEFALFLPIVFTLYWLFAYKHQTLRNSLLLVSSYVFYGWWDWRFLILIIISSCIDYTLGFAIYKTKTHRLKNSLLFFSLASNLGLLFFFKYYFFFPLGLANGLNSIGIQSKLRTLKLILPVGITFYTFQTLSQQSIRTMQKNNGTFVSTYSPRYHEYNKIY